MDKELKKLLKKYSSLIVCKKKRHYQIKHACKNGFITVSCTSSDRNYIFNVEKDILKLIG
jgi:hypothetical protein